MYTQCPDCSTVFRVTAEALRTAQGRVRCGICSAGFDALEHLSEAPIARSLDEAAHEDTITVEELPGNEFIELSAAANGPGVEDSEAPDAPDGPGEPAPAEAEAAPEAGPDVEGIPEEPPPPGKSPGRAPEDGPWPEQPGDIETAPETAPDEEDAAPETWPVAGEAPADAAAPDAEPHRPAADPLDSLPDTALEFHGSPEDLERLFVPAGAGLPAAEPAAPDLPQAFEEIASQDLSGIEVREEEFSWTGAAGEPFDPGNPAHVAAVLASSSGRPGKAKEHDLDRTDEYPVLVLEEGEALALRVDGDVDGAAVVGGGEEALLVDEEALLRQLVTRRRGELEVLAVGGLDGVGAGVEVEAT